MAKFFSIAKDGGPQSRVWGFWLFEIKWLGSIAILKFVGESRECYHTHAFNSLSWLLRGRLREEFESKLKLTKVYTPSIFPIITTRSNYHKVSSDGISWVLTFRGPWSNKWKEKTSTEEYYLTHGRNRIR